MTPLGARKEAEYTKLIADGWRPEDLTWIPVASPVSVELIHMVGEDATLELRKALDRAQSGQWVIEAGAVMRRVSAIAGRKLSLFDLLPPFVARVFGSRGAR